MLKDPKFRTSENSKTFAINKETRDSSGLVPDIDGGNKLKTGKPTEGKFHSTKARYAITALNGRLSSGKLNKEDKTAVRSIIKDLKAALSGH